ncbi:MAG: Gx transporter family protein [Lachnospiraceae bacterium]|nr:Gx transporter family protein [Lachnospiraceae bacterium]
MKNGRLNARNIAYYGIAGTLAIVLSMLESVLVPYIPGLPPGAKPGLSNVVVMLLAATGQTAGLLFPVLMKSIFVLLTRGMSAFLMSLSGGILSAAAMILMHRAKLKSIGEAGIGIVSACMHNAGQLLVSFFYTGTAALIWYLPVLLLFGAAAGLATGIFTAVLLPHARRLAVLFRKESGSSFTT